MTTQEQRKLKIAALLKRCQEEIAAAQDDCSKNYLHSAISRAYYAMFYATSALLLIKDIEVSKHSGVIAAFGREFVKTGEIESKYHAMLEHAFDERQTSDYDYLMDIVADHAQGLVQEAQEFCQRIKEVLENKGFTE